VVVSICKFFSLLLDSPTYTRRKARHDPGHSLTCFFPLLRRAATIDPCLPPVLSFLDGLLAIAATVISATAVIVAEFLPTSILYKLLVAFSASGHFDIPFHFHLTNPIGYHRKRN
jgi:hypothetical protein